ncbi:NACHT domain-containing protein [Streptomyces sp. WAC 04229]|uniref:NACHT domain-containing protein n=1 Tax=Streptomyces sp. WAC 04229 TaxID=2203206 RepID=UPI003D759437
MANVTPDEFEEEVRRVARALWPEAEHGGPEMVNGREVDGVFKTEEVLHMVEATMDRRIDKAHNVGPKLLDHLKKARKHGYFAKSWFVTYHPPTADQRRVLHNQYDRSIEIISYDQFRSKIINAREYLKLRDQVGWGSAANPKTNSTTDLVKYVPLGIYASSGVARPGISDYGRKIQREEPNNVSVTDLAMSVESGARIALLGDYGAGKSMTLREVHAYLKKRYLKGDTHIFPITLSLRRHYGQDDPAEALTRHGNYLGFQNPAKLVSAWRNGYAHILLDGFDELAAPGWSGSPEAIRENRRAATVLVKEFSRESQADTGIIVAGRRFYFDTLGELGEYLFDRAPHVIATLSDFSAEQAKTFLAQFNEKGAVPEWLPQRPLLLGHLAAEGILRGFEDSAGLAPAPGWEWLLDRISERESFIKQGVDGPAVRQVIEQLASFARQTSLGVGPVSMRDIVDAFTIVRKRPPSDRELTLLQRLPGLGGEEEDSENGTRRFVDQDLASAAQAAHVSRFVIDPYGNYAGFQPTQWHSAMEPLGVEVATEQISNFQVQRGILRTALARAIKTDCYELAADLVGVAIASGFDITKEGTSKHTVSGSVIPSLDLGEGGPDLSGVEFTDCMFEELVLSGDPDPSLLPLFNQCSFFTVIGRLGETDMPLGRFTDCTFESFPDAADRNAAIMESAILPAGTRVVMTLLRKLYLQRGRGRKDSALTRGMGGNDAALVTPAMQLLQQEGLAVPTRQGKNKIWLPDRSAGPRVRQFLAAPRVGDDPLVSGSRYLAGSGK